MEEAWELAAVSRASDLHSILFRLKVIGDARAGNNTQAIVKLYLEETKVANGVADFMSLYLRLVDASIDEAMSCSHLDQKRKDRIVMNLQRGRTLAALISMGAWSDTAGKLLTTDFLSILLLVDDTISAAGNRVVFDKTSAEKYKSELEIIFESILASDLNVHAKNPILANLKRLIGIFSSLSVIGPVDADLRIKALLGDIVMHGEEISNSSEDAKKALFPLLQFIQKSYPSFKWTVDHLMTGANVALLGIQTGAVG